MKKFLCCFALLAGSISGYAADVCTEEGFTFDVRQRDYLLSTVFEFNGKEQFLGSIVKEPFHLRTQYDLYSETGVFQGMGICRILTLGAIYAWGTEIDVYDERGGKVGVIDGQAVTGAAAKFSIYDGKGAQRTRVRAPHENCSSRRPEGRSVHPPRKNGRGRARFRAPWSARRRT